MGVQAEELNEEDEMQRYIEDKKANKESTCRELRKQILKRIPEGEEIEEVCMCVFSCVCLCIVHVGCDLSI